MAIDRTGISSLQTGAPEIKYTGDQGPKSPDQELMASADPILVEEYNKYVFELKEIRPEATPMSFKEFVQQVMSGMAEGGIARLGYKDGYSVQGGVKNYLGNQKTVSNVPVKWQSGPDKPETELAYITKAEKDLILKKDLHGSLQDGPNMGPGGLMSLDSWGDVGGGQAGADVSDSGGGGGGDPSTTYSYDPVAAAQVAAQQEAERVNQLAEARKLMTQKTPVDVPMGNLPLSDWSLEVDPYQQSFIEPGKVTTTGHYESPPATAVHPTAMLEAANTRGVTPIKESPYKDPDPENEYVPGDEQYEYAKSAAAMQDYMEGYGENVMKEALPTGGFREDTAGIGTGGDGGLGGTGANVPGTPIVPTEGITAAESAQAFEDAKAEQIAKVQAAAASGLPFKDYYVGGAPTAEQEKFMREQGAAASMIGREAWPAAEGGRARQRYGLGSIVKKAFKAVKKVAKSPVGMAALAAFGLPALAKFGAAKNWMGFGPQSFLGSLGKQGWKAAIMGGQKAMGVDKFGNTIYKDTPSFLSRIGDNPLPWIAAASASPFLFQDKYPTDIHPGTGDYGKGLDLLGIRKKILDKKGTREEFPYLNPDQYAPRAQGGRIGYAGGGDKYEEKVKALMDKMNISRALAETIILTQDYPDASDIIPGEKDGGRIGYQDGRSVRSLALNQLYGIMPRRKLAQEGGLMDLGGMEKDYREEGGFVPIGGQERADDVPARLSKNEFVFTADAGRAAGGGNIDKGAEVMENVMNNLEQGGQVSEESQGLEGARNMFATAQRLEGVL